MDFRDVAHRIIGKEVVDKSILFTPQNSRADLLFESIVMPPWWNFITPNDINDLHYLATSNKLAGNFDKKKAAMLQIMEARGFKFFAGGTNRIIFKHLEFPSIVAKVALDRVGLSDNGAEYLNQKRIWPYCAKMIQVAPTGVIGFAERVVPILNRYEFNAHALEIYIMLLQIIGNYVLEDIGESFFKNYGIRPGFGPVLVDYPYIFDLDGGKLVCHQHLDDESICCGEIDYDPGFNFLYCTRCGRRYNAAELKRSINREQIIITNRKGGQRPMNAKLMRGKEVVASNYSSDIIVKPDQKAGMAAQQIRPTTMNVRLSKGGKAVTSNATETSTHTFNIGGKVAKLEIPKADQVQPKTDEAKALEEFKKNMNNIPNEVPAQPSQPVVPASMLASISSIRSNQPDVPQYAPADTNNSEDTTEEKVFDKAEETKPIAKPIANIPLDLINNVDKILSPDEPEPTTTGTFPESPWADDQKQEETTSDNVVIKKKRILTDVNISDDVQIRQSNPYGG